MSDKPTTVSDLAAFAVGMWKAHGDVPVAMYMVVDGRKWPISTEPGDIALGAVRADGVWEVTISGRAKPQ